MGFFDGGFGAVVGAAAGLAGNALSGGVSAHSQYKYAKRLMKFQRMQNQEYAQWSAEKLPFMNRTGMEAAGFNPLLAITQGTGQQGNVSSGTPIQGQHKDFSNLGNTVASALNFYSRMQDMADRKALIDSQVQLTNAKTAQTLDQIENPKDLVTFFKKNLPTWFHAASDFSKRSGLADKIGDILGGVAGALQKVGTAKQLIQIHNEMKQLDNPSAGQYTDRSNGMPIYNPMF